MFHLFVKLAQLVNSSIWRKTNEQNDDDSVDDDDDSVKDEGQVNSPDFKRITKSVYGRVTSMHHGYGLVDHHIYFDVGVVCGSSLPREGDQVIVVVTKNVSNKDNSTGLSLKDGLVADSVQIIRECWDSTEVEDKCRGIVRDESGLDTRAHVESILERSRIGPIIKIDHDRIFVHGGICLALKDVRFSFGYTPYPGDWITLRKFNDDEFNDGSNVEVIPLRTQTINGRITSIDDDIAVVENEAYFHLKDCPNGYVPSIDDIINGKAIENTALAPEYLWRYMSFAPPITVESQRLQQHVEVKVRNLTELVLNKNGIVVASPLDFGIVLVGKRAIITAFIKNEGLVNQMLIRCTFEDDSTHKFTLTVPKIQDTFEDAIDQLTPPECMFDQPSNALVIPPNGICCLNIICDAKNVGKTKELLIFEFEGFSIGRQVFVHVKDPMQDLITQNCGPTIKNDPIREPVSTDDSSIQQYIVNLSSDSLTVPGRYIQKKTRVHQPISLGKYPIPMDLLDCIDNRQLLLGRVPYLTDELSMHNYKLKFSTLLHLEEISQDNNMKHFNMRNVCLRKAGDFLVLEVPGLAEGRPSLLTGDCLLATEPGIDGGIGYEACIHDVRGREIYLKFHEEFHNRFADELYDITFYINRTTLRRCHQAITLWKRIGKDILFPERSEQQSSTSAQPFRFERHMLFNKQLNERQLQAVRCVVEGRGRPFPYIIYGPPGSGKTVTLVEAVLQVFLQQSSSRILVCAPSNSAADLVCERLHDSGKFKTCDLVRLNAFHRKQENLSDVVRLYSDFSQDYYIILRYRIIVTTCVTSGLLYALGVPPGNFTHLFIDEAGQSTEPESVISMCLATAHSEKYESVCARPYITNREAFQVILAGDPKQLGPVIMSRHATTYGLQMSLLERLSKRRLYQRNEKYAEGYDSNHVTKLIENYRSHPAIIKLPSQLFYDSELVAKAESATLKALDNWEILPNKGFPILFNGVKGEDLKEMDSPSWFNAEEVVVVVNYLQSLYRHMKFQPDDIGIITPYRKQVDMIRMFIKSVGAETPKVGSVEEFQGQERRVIIVSTVRSSASWIRFDDAHNLGFVFNEKRFNVTITRAKSLLIIVGNPFVLIKDKIWRAFLRYCITNNAYIGCEVNEILGMINSGQMERS